MFFFGMLGIFVTIVTGFHLLNYLEEWEVLRPSYPTATAVFLVVWIALVTAQLFALNRYVGG